MSWLEKEEFNGQKPGKFVGCLLSFIKHFNRTVTRTDGNGKSHSETVTDYFRNHETYVKQETVLHGGPGLPPGIHYFPFSFMLPPNLPSSFESKIGNVRYFVKADIVRDWKWNHKVKQHFMVNGILDLNTYPSAKEEGRYL